ncbi:MAG: NADH-quinone oxidoreductase subunit NuoK [Planctomycetota bacterium]|nr:NADH-quinone oxidoreductase subunit NuoK [Planctomycetota bacterium]
MSLLLVITLQHYLVVAAALFCAGLIAVLSRRNAVAILIGIELMLNAANVNLVAFDHYNRLPGAINGQIFALFVLAIAAAEAAVALALILNVFDSRDRIDVDQIDTLKG